jgi:nicotinate-nucleotide adenylyltransferase
MAPNLTTPIGIFGGTFDPIHLGHLHLAKEAQKQLKLASIYFIPCYLAPFAKTIYTSAEQRVTMLQLALADHTNFILDTREIKRQDLSYTIYTLQSLRQELPNNPFCLLLGQDAFANFDKWHNFEKILEYTHLIVTDRKENSLRENAICKKLLQEHEIFDSMLLSHSLAGKILKIEIKALPIAATQIRALIKSGKSAAHLLPAKVWEYINQEKLYT